MSEVPLYILSITPTFLLGGVSSAAAIDASVPSNPTVASTIIFRRELCARPSSRLHFGRVRALPRRAAGIDAPTRAAEPRGVGTWLDGELVYDPTTGGVAKPARIPSCVALDPDLEDEAKLVKIPKVEKSRKWPKVFCGTGKIRYNFQIWQGIKDMNLGLVL